MCPVRTQIRVRICASDQSSQDTLWVNKDQKRFHEDSKASGLTDLNLRWMQKQSYRKCCALAHNDDDFGVLRPFQYYLSHVKSTEG